MYFPTVADRFRAFVGKEDISVLRRLVSLNTDLRATQIKAHPEATPQPFRDLH